MRILIIRHGDPDYVNDTLTEKGHREAALLAAKLGKEKIDYFYSSPLGRARHTCDYVAKAHGKQSSVVVKDWLKEFGCPMYFPSGELRHIPWDMLPKDWVDKPAMYDKDEWYKQGVYAAANMEKFLRAVTDGLDALLASHGYRRDGNIYRTEKGHTDTIALFCHGGLEMVLLSHLCGVAPMPMWHHFVALPSSVTTLYTEERIEGEAVFRCCGFGDIGHLYAGGEEPSKSSRFPETFHSDCKHD